MNLNRRNIVAILIFTIFVSCAVPLALIHGPKLFKPESPFAVDWDDATLRKKTYQYVFRERGERAQKLHSQLWEIDEKAAPFAIEILADDGNARKLLAPIVERDGTQELPLRRACRMILRPETRLKVAPALVKYADVADEKARGEVCKILASTGDDTYLPIVLKALESTEDVWDATTDGLAFAIDAKRLSPGGQASLYPVLERVALQESRLHTCIMYMSAMDEERAIAWASKQGLLQASNPSLPSVLEAMSYAGILPERSEMHRIIDDARRDTSLPRRAYVLERCYHYLAYFHDLDDELLFTGCTEDADVSVAIAAAEGLMVWHHLDTATTNLLLHRGRYESLPLQVRIHDELHTINWTVADGGFVDYFDRWSSEWKLARQGLIEIGAVKSLKLLDEAVGVVGEKTMSLEEWDRKTRIAELSRAQLQELEHLSAQWRSDEERRAVRIPLYAVANAQYFSILLESK